MIMKDKSEEIEKIASKMRLRFVMEFITRENLGQTSEEALKDIMKSIEDSSFFKANL